MKKEKGKEEKKARLAKAARQTKWAPFWTIQKKLGKGKKVHPARITVIKRSWRRTKLKIPPRRIRKRYLG